MMHPHADAIAKKVQYELSMFRYAYQRMQNEWLDSDSLHRNILLETFLLHARVLRDFFVQNPKGDDVSASHFYDDPNIWISITSNHCTYLQNNRTRLNKYLAHLTYDRINEDKNWQTDIIFKEVCTAWELFHSMLNKDQQALFKD